jgi:hypothetical protein
MCWIWRDLPSATLFLIRAGRGGLASPSSGGVGHFLFVGVFLVLDLGVVHRLTVPFGVVEVLWAFTKS